MASYEVRSLDALRRLDRTIRREGEEWVAADEYENVVEAAIYLSMQVNRIENALERHGSHTPGMVCIECGTDRPWKSVIRDILDIDKAATGA